MYLDSGHTDNGTHWELRQGVDGRGGNVFILYIGNGMHRFGTEDEARAWIAATA